VARRPFAGARLRSQGFDAHALHQRCDVAPDGLDDFGLEWVAQQASAHERAFKIQRVDAARRRQIGCAGSLGQTVHRAPAYARQVGLADDGEVAAAIQSLPCAQRTRVGERAFYQIILQRQLADIGMQRCQVHWLGYLGSTANGMGRLLKQLPLRFGDVVGMHLGLPAQLG
jgi:hypothetical protein